MKQLGLLICKANKDWFSDQIKQDPFILHEFIKQSNEIKFDSMERPSFFSIKLGKEKEVVIPQPGTIMLLSAMKGGCPLSFANKTNNNGLLNLAEAMFLAKFLSHVAFNYEKNRVQNQSNAYSAAVNEALKELAGEDREQFRRLIELSYDLAGEGVNEKLFYASEMQILNASLEIVKQERQQWLMFSSDDKMQRIRRTQLVLDEIVRNKGIFQDDMTVMLVKLQMDDWREQQISCRETRVKKSMMEFKCDYECQLYGFFKAKEKVSPYFRKLNAESFDEYRERIIVFLFGRNDVGEMIELAESGTKKFLEEFVRTMKE